MTQTTSRADIVRRRFVIASAVLATAMGFIDGSIVAIAMPAMRSALGASFVEAQWIANAYVLFLAALIMVGGAAGDRYGTRRVFAWGIIVFVIFSSLCAIAWSPMSLIVFRALQGIGAAFMIPGSMALVARHHPKDQRGRALGIWVAASSITTACGPLVGGLLLTYGGTDAWRLIFAINIPVGALALVFLKLRVPPDAPKERVRALDLPGAMLFAVALGALALGLTMFGEVEGRSTIAWSMLGVGAIVLLMAIIWERRVTDPMIDLSLFRSPAFSGVNVLTFVVWSGLSANIFFLPMLLIVAWNLPPILAAGVFLPFSLLISVLSPIAGRLVDRYGVRPLLTIGPLISAAGYVALAYAIAVHEFWYGVVPSVALIGVGIGLTASPVSSAAVAAVDDADTGAASGINNLFARMSNLFAIAGLGAGVSAAYALIVRGSSIAPDLADALIETGFGERLTGPLYQIRLVDLHAAAMNHAMIALCLVVAVMSVVGAAIGWFTQRQTPSK